MGRKDALAGDHECGRAQGNAASFRGVPNLREGVENDFFEALIDLVLGPEIAGDVLHPLEIADGDAAGVGMTSGTNTMPFAARMSSASGVVGPFAPSSSRRVRTSLLHWRR